MPPAKPRIARTCQQCQRTFGVLESRLKWGVGIYCSPECQRQSKRRRVELRCATCRRPFMALPHDQNRARFCSRACVRYGLTIPLPDRFWRHVVKREPHECWLWQSLTDRSGYGAMMMTQPVRRVVLAHRISYELHYGPIPPGMIVRHACDNPSCVNPAHLSIGTKAQNSADMRARQRNKRGEQHYFAKLTATNVRGARKRQLAGESIAALAREFGVGQGTMADVVRRRTWKHVL